MKHSAKHAMNTTSTESPKGKASDANPPPKEIKEEQASPPRPNNEIRHAWLAAAIRVGSEVVRQAVRWLFEHVDWIHK